MSRANTDIWIWLAFGGECFDVHGCAGSKLWLKRRLDNAAWPTLFPGQTYTLFIRIDNHLTLESIRIKSVLDGAVEYETA